MAGVCGGEIAGAECSLGDSKSTSCGKCGTRLDTCNPTACTWTAGVCGGEGVCVPAEVLETKGVCPDAGDIEKKTCTVSCGWSAAVCYTPKGCRKLAAPPVVFLAREG